jgi:outer membrane protein assembly factor BamE (lipoprotein component of BamABCDE complex)
MKTKSLFLVIILAVAIFAISPGCKVYHPKHKSGTVVTPNESGKVPPGQAKKATGTQSAKEYAPGQNKGKKNK